MGLDDKIQNKAEDLGGRAKEAAGAAAGDDSLKAEGEADQRKAGIKDKVENVKDKVQDKIDDVL
ncbi:MAG: CsbD family protein [Marmoricola sp.]